jgi:hypothetical protein
VEAVIGYGFLGPLGVLAGIVAGAAAGAAFAVAGRFYRQ